MEPEHDELPPEGARYKNPNWNPGAIPPETLREQGTAASAEDATPPAGILVPITARDFRERWVDLARFARLSADQIRKLRAHVALARDLNDLVADLERLKAYVEAPANESTAPPAARLWPLFSVPDELAHGLQPEHKALLSELTSYVRALLTPEQWTGVESRDATIFETMQFAYLPYVFDRLSRLNRFAKGAAGAKSPLADGLPALLDHKQRQVFAEASEDIQLNLVQVLKALELPGAAEYFSVDLIEWFSLKSRGFVNEEHLSREQLTDLKDFKPFSVALGRRPLPHPSPTVPIQLVEFQTNWEQLSSLARITKHDRALIEFIERPKTEGDVVQPFLDEDQKDQLTTAGYTYISLQQVERLYSVGRSISVSPAVWLTKREVGVVFDDFLSEDVVYKLRSYEHFRNIYDNKYNKPLIAQRQAEQRRIAQEEAQRERQDRREKRRKTYRALFLFVLLAGGVALSAYEYNRRAIVDSAQRTSTQATQPTAPTTPQTAVATPSAGQAPQSQIYIQSREQAPIAPLGTDSQPSAAGQSQNALYWQGVSNAAVAAFDGIGPVMLAAGRGDDQDTLAIEIRRVRSLKYPLDGVFPLGSRPTARKLNEEALAVFRDNPNSALTLQASAFAAYANDTEIAGNLAHYLLLNEHNEHALLTALYALAVPPGKLATGSPANWQVLASAFARLDRTKNAEDAFLVGLAITANLDGFCRSLLRHGTEFGPKVQSVVTTIFKKIQDRGPPSDVPSCAYPPSF